jgi:hypothetical protein
MPCTSSVRSGRATSRRANYSKSEPLPANPVMCRTRMRQRLGFVGLQREETWARGPATSSSAMWCKVPAPSHTDSYYDLYRRKHMAKATATRRTATGGRRRRSGSRSGWVRKNVVMDQRKLDTARRLLGVDTETEAIDQALDFVAFGEELARGFAAVRRSGGVDDVLESRRRT